jgi:hypothetical protein
MLNNKLSEVLDMIDKILIRGRQPHEPIVVPDQAEGVMPFLLRFLETPRVSEVPAGADMCLKYLGVSQSPNGRVADYQRD